MSPYKIYIPYKKNVSELFLHDEFSQEPLNNSEGLKERNVNTFRFCELK